MYIYIYIYIYIGRQAAGSRCGAGRGTSRYSHFTYFTGTKLQKLTLKTLLGLSSASALYADVC